MNRRKSKKVVAIMIALTFIFSILFSFNNFAKAEESKTTASLDLSYESSKKISIVFILGKTTNLTEVSREDIINALSHKELWNEIWTNYTSNYVDLFSLQFNIIGNINNSFNDFLDKILGTKNNTLIIKRLEKIQYPNAIGIEIEAINSKSTLTIVPLKFIIDGKYDINTFIRVNVGYDISMMVKFDQKKFNTAHFRALVYEEIKYEKTTNEITISENPALSPSYLFIFLLICTIVIVGLTVEASRRNEKVSVSVLPWVFGFILYFLAFIPFSNFLVYVALVTGLAIAIERFRKGILFGKKSKRDRYHHAMTKEAKVSAKKLLDGKFQPEKVVHQDKNVSSIAHIDDNYFIYEKLEEYGNFYFTIHPSSLEIYRELGKYVEDIYMSGILEDEFIEDGEEIKLYDADKEQKKKK